jgi:cation transport ATPase
MSDNPVTPNLPGDSPEESPPQYSDGRTAKRAERKKIRDERRRARASRRGGGWIAGIVLILLGLVFLLQNIGGFSLQNWWAVFILIPALGSFASAWNTYQNSGGFTAAVRGPLVGGLFLTAIALIFLFNISFGIYWPVLLIIGGLLILASVLLPG